MGKLKGSECILYSGAAQGAEAEFGAAAQKHGVEEVNFTFEGHTDARTRGIRVLTQAELKRGDVSLAYVSRLMHREYRDTPLFRKVLQSIWHQVNTAGEVFVVGTLLQDQTVKGGTGLAAELARHWNTGGDPRALRPQLHVSETRTASKRKTRPPKGRGFAWRKLLNRC